MNVTYIIPTTVNPYNGSLENVICTVTKSTSEPKAIAWREILPGNSDDKYRIYISNDFMNLSKVSQRFILLEQFAELCYSVAASHLSNDDELKKEMIASPEMVERVISVNVISRMVALYGIRNIEDAINELYKNEYFSFVYKQRYKELLKMYTYGDPYDVRMLRDKMSLANGAKCSLEDVEDIFICKDDKFNIATAKYEKF